MKCQKVQLNLSLYLYGELEFRQEEEVEAHLADCALCQAALRREKSWHSSLNGAQLDVPLVLLSECRQNLKFTAENPPALPEKRTWNWSDLFNVRASAWSAQLAVASFLVFVGFTAGRHWSVSDSPVNESSLIRDIEFNADHKVQITLDQVRQRQVSGGVDDSDIRHLLLYAAKTAPDPGIRVDSVELLNGQSGIDVRDALLTAVKLDPNSAVRLKALDGLRQFADDTATRNTLEFVLEHDGSPEVRSQAIDVLIPASQGLSFTPDLIKILQGVSRFQEKDSFVHDRCSQVLQQMRKPAEIY
jgi:hypothetical protein